MSDPIRVVLVDDQELIRAGLRMVVDSQPDLTVVGEAGDGGEAVRLLATVPADVVLMDVRMPRMNGVEATARIVEQAAGRRPSGAPPLRVVVLTTFDLDEYALPAVRAGASGFLLKDSPPEQLLAAIRTVHSGEAVIAPSTTRRLLDRVAPLLAPADADGRLDELTDRERDVLALMARGLSNAEIAEDLVIAQTTVKTHVGRILTKLEVRDRVQAVVAAYETGLVRPGGGRPAAATT